MELSAHTRGHNYAIQRVARDAGPRDVFGGRKLLRNAPVESVSDRNGIENIVLNTVIETPNGDVGPRQGRRGVDESGEARRRRGEKEGADRQSRVHGEGRRARISFEPP